MNGRLRGRAAAALLGAVLTLPPAGAHLTAQPAPEGLSIERLDALLEADETPSLEQLVRHDAANLLALAAFFGLALTGFLRKNTALEYATLVAAVGYLGFARSNLVSIVNIFALVDWNFPLVRYNLAWYLLIAFTLASTVLWGRVYCSRICAYGALTQLLDRLLPARLRIEPPAWIDRRTMRVKYAILGGAVVYFMVTADVSIHRYIEPFWLFSLNGSASMWVVVILLLVATVFVRNVYCRYLCPVGAALGLLSHLTLFRIARWRECTSCKLCERACAWGAIEGPAISVRECVRCDDCERLSVDAARCPHWIILKRPAVRGESPASHRDRQCASLARRDEGK